MKRHISFLTVFFALAVIYFLAGKFGLSLAFINASASAVWPPTGIALAAVLLLGYRVWPAIALAAFLVNFTTAGSFATSLGIAAGNTLEALLGAWLVNRFAQGKDALEQPGAVFKFVVFAGMLSTMVSSTLGVATLCLGGFARWENYGAIWLTWWVGDLVSDVVVAPLLLAWSARPYPQWKLSRILEALLLSGLIILIGQTVFGGWAIPKYRGYPLAYLAIPPLLWAAWRFGQRGASLATMAISVMATLGLLRGFGPFTRQDHNEALLFLQVFMTAIAPTALVLAAVIRQRNQTLRRLTMQYDVGRALAESVTPAEANRRIIQIVCTSLEWDLGTNWMVDMRDQVLRVTDSWSRPSMDVAEFEELNRNISLKSGEGLPGAIWARGRPDWIDDLTSAKNFTRIPIALRNNLHAGFGFPILSGSKVLGVMEFFSRKIRRPDSELLDTVAAIGRQIGQFIERKQAEAALQQSNALKAGIVRAALDCIVTMNQAGVIVEFNPAAEATFGYRREEVIGRLMAEVIIPPALREAHARGLARYLATGEGPVLGKRLELTGMKSDGSLFAVELAITRIESDGPPLFAGFLRDISAAKQAAEALRESAERLRFMAESMPQKIFTAKADGRIDYFNRQWTEFTGLSFEQIRDWGWTQFVHAEDVEENVRGWKHSIATGEPFQMQHRFRRADGVYRWHLSRAHAMRDNAGRVLMWIGSNTDIEDQKRAEQNLERVVAERTAKLQDTIADLEAFSYSISHDLRAPLRSIAGYIRVIQEDFKEQVLPQVEGYFRRISTAAIRMDQLIQDVLTLSSVAKSDMRMGAVDVEKLLGGILDTYPNLQPPQAEIQFDGPLPPVMGNEAALTQCISNLLGNAVKFVAPGVTPRVRIWAQERDSHVRFLFQDNGIGIPKEVHKKIFGMFQRLSTTYQGTGIGLAIVQKSVERMGGEVGVESEPGKGSTFWVELKSAEPQQAPGFSESAP
ncbi:MAG: hypothetical protein JWR26_942 [Pedosphaera sp.]|nr:hypothetical protein [Pedosphaera sp.]